MEIVQRDLLADTLFVATQFAVPSEEFLIDPVKARALEIILILHMDHEQNASTSTVRGAGSSQANPFACIASGIAALWGPAHGGANEAVLSMLEEIGTVDNIPEFLFRVKNKIGSQRLMGFGHRVYKTWDPRAEIMKETCDQVLHRLDKYDPLLDIAQKLEQIALNDEYFKTRNLYPNVDFYSGITLRALGIPRSMFTVLFAVARTVGWVAQWREMACEKTRICRPRQMYIGEMHRDVPQHIFPPQHWPEEDKSMISRAKSPGLNPTPSRLLGRTVSVKWNPNQHI